MKKLFILFFFISNYCSAQINLSQGLAAYYPFNGNAKDESGNNNNASFNNATLTFDRDGKANSAYHFNGRNQFIKIPNSPSINFKKSFSISVWVLINDFYEGECHGNRILNKGDADYLKGNYYLQFEDGYYTKGQNCSNPMVDKKHQTFSSFPVTPILSTQPYITTNKWYNLTYTYDGVYSKLYVDCELYGSDKLPGYTFINEYDLFLGRLNDTKFPYWFNGDMDEIRIYDRALSSEEILTFCNKTLEPKIDFNYTITECNKVQFKIINAENIKSYTWNLGDKSSAIKDNFIHTYKKDGIYNVKLVAIGIDGKQIKISKTLTIAQPNASFTYSVSPNSKLVNFTINQNKKNKYIWDFGDGEKSKKQNAVTHTYKAAGKYDVTLIVQNKNGCKNSAVKAITILDDVVTQKDSVINTITKQNQPDTLNKINLEKRTKDVVKTIEILHDSITVTFYDNAEVDGDSVTVIYNNTILATHKMLTDKPLTYTLGMDKSKVINELIMYAENLGSIPPNTALMVIYDGEKRYELSVSSTTNSNGVVNFILKR